VSNAKDEGVDEDDEPFKATPEFFARPNYEPQVGLDQFKTSTDEKDRVQFV
jgi:hypothetical protein